jgi:propanol-preferring alcohol dehydrogenase
MRALVLEAPGPAASRPLRLLEVPDPSPAPGEILVEVAACAVCRTDLQLAEGDLPAHRSPVIPGHQAVGRVVGLGSAAGAWRVGERVGVTWLAGTCGECRSCLTGRQNLCREAVFTGWDRDGGFAERMTVRADVAVRIPEGFDDLAAAPLLCGGVIGYRSLAIAGVRPGDRLGLFGFGSSARLVIQVARHRGCEVFVWTRSPAERARAVDLGAAWVGSYEERAPAPVDAAITFAPSGDVVLAALAAVDRGGTVAINAIHLDRIPAFSYDRLWWERSLRSVANVTSQDAREFLALAQEIPIRTDVEVHSLEDGPVALERLATGAVTGTAVIVTPGGARI